MSLGTIQATLNPLEAGEMRVCCCALVFLLMGRKSHCASLLWLLHYVEKSLLKGLGMVYKLTVLQLLNCSWNKSNLTRVLIFPACSLSIFRFWIKSSVVRASKFHYPLTLDRQDFLR